MQCTGGQYVTPSQVYLSVPFLGLDKEYTVTRNTVRSYSCKRCLQVLSISTPNTQVIVHPKEHDYNKTHNYMIFNHER